MPLFSLFSASLGHLSVFGDGQDNAIEASRDAAGKIKLNGGAVPGTPTVANTAQLTVFGLHGADTITVNGLPGTDVTEVEIDLGGLGGADDGQADTGVINAIGADDAIVVVSDGAGLVRVLGLSAEMRILNFGAGDRLVINGQGGDDAIAASGLLAGLPLTADGGEGDDAMIGGPGIDVLTDTVGDDILILWCRLPERRRRRVVRHPPPFRVQMRRTRLSSSTKPFSSSRSARTATIENAVLSGVSTMPFRLTKCLRPLASLPTLPRLPAWLWPPGNAVKLRQPASRSESCFQRHKSCSFAGQAGCFSRSWTGRICA